MTHVLVQITGSDRRYWRQTDQPAGEWVDRGLATRWPLAMQGHEQKARLLLHAREHRHTRTVVPGLSPEAALRLRVVKLKARQPVDLDALWEAAEHDRHPFAIYRSGSSYTAHVLVVEYGRVVGFGDRAVTSHSPLRALLKAVATLPWGKDTPVKLLGQPTTTTEAP